MLRNKMHRHWIYVKRIKERKEIKWFLGKLESSL